jgi:hypothetical protein
MSSSGEGKLHLQQTSTTARKGEFMKRKSGWIVACAALLSCALATAGYGVTNGEKVSVKGLIT